MLDLHERYYEPDENGRLWLQHRFEGTNEERKQYVIYFNEKVKEFCKNYNYTFLDVKKYLNKINYSIKKKIDKTNFLVTHNKILKNSKKNY
jgi:predicted solute-binding protein